MRRGTADTPFFIFSPGATAEPPADAPIHGTADTAMLADFETHFAAMNQSVIDAQARARLAPPPAPPAEGSSKFWRIHADWGLDTDMDGSADYAEFAMAANATAGSPNALADPMNGDKNDNGIPDGEELDGDEDGLPDLIDAVPGDVTIAWEATLPTRFAFFPVDGPAPPPGEVARAALQTNNQGCVLFPTALWKEGALLTLPPGEPDGEITDCKAWGMNNLGWILGVGTGRYIHRSSSNVIGVIEGSVYSYWSDHTAEPVKVDLTDGENPLPPAAVPETPEPEAPTGSFFPHDCVIDDAGRLYARGEGFAVAPYSRHSLWTADGDEFTRADAADYLRHVLAPDHGWGAENGATKLIGSAAHDFELLYPRFAALPSGGLAAFSGRGGPSEYQHGGNWGVRANFSESIDCTASGIMVQRNNLLWWNGRIREIRDVAPALPQAWQENTDFLDAAPAGWILAKKRNTPTPEAALLAPMSLKDDQPDSGVDAMSLLADTGTTGYQERLWIMAPMEDANSLDIVSPACGTGRITLEAEDRYTIGGGASTVLAQATQTISVAGADGPEGEDQTIDTGLTLKMGTSASLSAPIGVKVMERREIKVAVFGITQSAVDPVDLLPQAEAALEAHLDAIFSKQINAKINVLLHPTPVVVNWDTDLENGRLKKDFDANDPKTTTEMNTIIAAAPDPAAQIHVYLVSGPDVLGDKTDGLVIPKTNFCWIHGDEIGQRHNAGTLADTIAHELGHVLVGPGHPDQNYGRAPLKGINPVRHRERLMCSGNHKRTGSLLVKAEWDWSEIWMNANISEPAQ